MHFETGIRANNKTFHPSPSPSANDNNKLEFLLENEKKMRPCRFWDSNGSPRPDEDIEWNFQEKRRKKSDFTEHNVHLKESEILDIGVTVMPVFCGALGLNLKSWVKMLEVLKIWGRMQNTKNSCSWEDLSLNLDCNALVTTGGVLLLLLLFILICFYHYDTFFYSSVQLC